MLLAHKFTNVSIIIYMQITILIKLVYIFLNKYFLLFSCLRNTNTSSADHISVNLKDFHIIYRIDNLQEEKSMGMIIYKKQHIKLISVDPYQSTYYQSVICLFTVGYVCFLYMVTDGQTDKLTELNLFNNRCLDPCIYSNYT